MGIEIKVDDRFRERENGAPDQGLRPHPERWKSENWDAEWGESVESVRKRNMEALMDWMPNIVEIVFNGKEAVEINELAHVAV